MDENAAHSATHLAIDTLGDALDQLAATIGGLEGQLASVRHDATRHRHLRAEVQAALRDLDGVIAAANGATEQGGAAHG